MSRRSWVLAVVALSGCGGGIERVSFVTDLITYARDGRVGLEMTNVSPNPVGVNLCLSQLVSADGKTTGPSEGSSCLTLEATPLQPGKSVEVRKTIPNSLAPGRWRYATTITLPNGSGEKVLTPEFTVEP